MYKILGGLNRADLAQKINEKLNNIEKSAEEDFDISRKTGIGFVDEAGIKTLEKNVENLDAIRYDMEFDVDPLFKKTS